MGARERKGSENRKFDDGVMHKARSADRSRKDVVIPRRSEKNSDDILGMRKGSCIGEYVEVGKKWLDGNLDVKHNQNTIEMKSQCQNGKE